MKGRGEISRIVRETGLAFTTVQRAATHGKLIEVYDCAKRISDATGGVVSVKELCEPVVLAELEDAPTQPVPRPEAAG